MEIKITLVITTYKRYDTFLKKNLNKYLQNSYIHEIIVSDDCSEDYEKVKDGFENEIKTGKIKLVRTPKNLGPLKNKIFACGHAQNEWLCLMDSDNFCDVDYFEALIEYWNKNGINERIIYSPSVAGKFNFTEFLNTTVDKTNFLSKPISTFINLGNNVFNKKILEYLLPEYEREFKYIPLEVKYMNYIWIKNGIVIKLVPNMIYDHVCHDGSFYMHNHVELHKFEEELDWKI